ncbi:MAG: hypothetical protein H7301_00970 [Cryobacterium sp.]|nr:hypothetical protein [Oligoflexia bacterium]
MLTHDLRTPLTAAKMSAQLFSRKSIDPEAMLTLANRITQNIDRDDQMIRDLSDASLIHAGEPLSIESSECHLNSIVSKTVENLVIIYGDRFVVEGSSEIHGY